MKRDKAEASRGYLLVSTYVLISMASIISLGLLTRSTFLVQAVERNQNKLVAFNMAEAATDQAMVQIQTDINYTGTGGYTSFNSTFVKGGYEVTVSTPSGHSDIRVIQAVGYAPDNQATSRAFEKRSLTVYAQLKTQNNFDFGVFAKSSMTLSGSGNVRVDSYDSNIAPYDFLAPGTDGDIATNSTADGAITLTGNAQVYGDAAIGPQGDPQTAINLGNNTLINGTSTSSSETRALPVVTSSITSSGDLSIGGSSTVSLASGVYRFNSISITSQGQLTVEGPVTIYVDGDVNIAGQGISNTTLRPPSLILYSQGTDVQVSGGSDFYGAIYAPHASVKVSGNSSVYGAVVGNSYSQVGNGSLHFDTALKDSGGSNIVGVEVVAWQEQGSVNWGMGA